MPPRPEIDTLVRQVANRHHRLLARRVLFVALAAGAALCLTGSLSWVLRGHAVPVAFPLLVALLTIITGFAIWQFRKMNTDGAARECIRAILHTGDRDSTDIYLALPWEALCGAVERVGKAACAGR